MSKNIKKVKEFTINIYNKGFVASNRTDGVLTQEYIQFKNIQFINYYINKAVEIIYFNGIRRVFYNDVLNQSRTLYDTINNKILLWTKSNTN